MKQMNKQLIILTICASAIFGLPQILFAEQLLEQGGLPKAVIVIDDLGNNMTGTEEMLNLPYPITVAIMPFLPSTKSDAEAAHRKGHDVIVHLPMEPLKGNRSWLGPGAITCDLSDEEIRKRVNAAIDDVPHAIGINNHMGSKATVDERVMNIVLTVCHERGLFFLDSHTNYRSIVSKVARQIGVPCIENHIFLDDIKNKKHVMKQLRLLQQHLTEHEKCVAIGHVGAGGKGTAEVIKQVQAQARDIEFVGISKLIEGQGIQENPLQFHPN
ncbi:divergent polysaccharide deacetylase family protein [Paenibacillus validus]|nr:MULTISPECIES: divergent polysaccharide deacetylase family protein [Paenibacillus]MED4600419.1 divergent polysaccharide deacetylase family protein [Paenibacillus validus]MED4607862.1 divergent polysaccharide deacetylase family protein [Paenibacillus validus]